VFPTVLLYDGNELCTSKNTKGASPVPFGNEIECKVRKKKQILLNRYYT
jgi:hypothetical protein